MPLRRADDKPDAVAKVKDRALATVFLTGSIGFLGSLAHTLTKHSQWTDFQQPQGAGELVFCLVCGLVAISAALGLDVSRLVKGFTVS